MEANNIAVDIDNEICTYCFAVVCERNLTPFSVRIFTATIHKFVKDKYQKRFPELDSLIMAEMDYIRSVRELGNDLDQAKNNERLQEIITQATIMIVSVTASTTQGFVCRLLNCLLECWFHLRFIFQSEAREARAGADQRGV